MFKEYTCTDYTFDENMKFIPAEANETLGDGSKNLRVLGRMVGVHFMPNSESRNGRWYPKELWYEQLEKPQIKERVVNHSMLGTIGHNLEINEDAIRDGKVSHYTTNLRIEPTGDPKMPYRGIGESIILDTPAGRTLKACLDGDVKFWVSSRADGDFLPGQYHRTSEGKEIPILDKDKFRLERFDFVLSPGFLQAKPELQEELGINNELLQSICESYQEFENNSLTEVPIKESNMKDKVSQIIGTDKGNELIPKAVGDVVIKVTDDNAISISRTNATPSTAKDTDHPHDKIATLPNDKGSISGDCPQNTLNLTEGLLADLLKQNEELREQIKQLTATMSAHENVASDNDPNIINLYSKKQDDQLKKIDPQDIMGSGKVSDKNTADLLKSLKTFEEKYGDLDNTSELLDMVAAFFEEYGGPKEVTSLMKDMQEFHEEYGSQETLADFVDNTNEFWGNVGTPDEILTVFKAHEDLCHEVGYPEELRSTYKFMEQFFGKYGPAELIAESLDAADALFDEVGNPDEIRQTKIMLENFNNKISMFQELGLDNIADMKAVLQEIQEVKLRNEALSIAEHTGLKSELVCEHLKNGMSERQIVDLYNKDNELGFHRKFLTVRENAQPSDRIPLKMVDPDGDHVRMKNAFCVKDVNESLLDKALDLSRGASGSVFSKMTQGI